MTIQETTPAEMWLGALIDATSETSTLFLELGDLRVTRRSECIPDLTHAGFVSLTGERSSIQVVISASNDACRELASKFLNMDEDDPQLTQTEIVDAFGEFANIVAGAVKQQVSEQRQTMLLGLPLVVAGKPRLSNGQFVVSADCMMGHIPLALLIITNTE
ncbi:MAG TPA: hypothetical protein DCY79_03400 [Planctomycetaceae bacterium]|nr:hypothetical protein [Planctomycetaceae bacterium]